MSGRVDGKEYPQGKRHRTLQKEKLGTLPHCSHQLPSNNRITTIRSDAQIKENRSVRVGSCVAYCNNVLVEVHRGDLLIEKHTDVGRRHHLVQKSLIEYRPVDRIYTLFSKHAEKNHIAKNKTKKRARFLETRVHVETE